ncbi:MAG TPA: GNAT family N-acetyltransferase [Bacteroidota bacterium]|nr:GNAT family N-acetyltransferase [Bacteroidota bacterium]
MIIHPCHENDKETILEILNDAILHSTALYDYKPRTMQMMDSWFDAKRKAGYPVIGAFSDNEELLGFSSYGSFRNWPAYKYTVEHSLYVKNTMRGKGIGKILLQEIIKAAADQNYHVIVGGIDASNTVSIKLHESMGFRYSGTIEHAGYKFGKWLDLAFYQLILKTPETPTEG